MGRLKRAEVFDPEEIAIVHVMNRCVRRCFLLGDDPISGKNYDHRKAWIESQLQQAAAGFGIDLLAFSLMSNHMHLVLRSRPDVVRTWDDTQVARRWLILCPKRKNADGSPKVATEPELNAIVHDPDKVRQIRRRLSDISWWMRLICQRIAQRANKEEDQEGKFWQSRFKAVRLIDDQALLACVAYVDLNPIRAAMAETLEESSYTSVQRRAQAIQRQWAACSTGPEDSQAVCDRSHRPSERAQWADLRGGSCRSSERQPDDFLSPVSIDELNDELGPQASKSPYRCSDKGFLSMGTAEYLQLLDWTARRVAPGKSGCTPPEAPPIFERLQLGQAIWIELVQHFGEYFSYVAGRPHHVDAFRSRSRRQRFYLRAKTRALWAS